MYWISSHWLRQNCQTKYNIGAACLTFLMYFFRCIILVVFWIKILELVIQILLLKFWAFYWELICFIWIKLQIKLFCFISHTNVSGPPNFVLSLRIYSDESCLLNHSVKPIKIIKTENNKSTYIQTQTEQVARIQIILFELMQK